MWFILALVVIASFYFASVIKLNRSLSRSRRLMLRYFMKDFVRMLADPASAGEVILTPPLLSDDDRAHAAIFTARHGQRQLSFILDTRRRHVRWSVMYELQHRENNVVLILSRVRETFVGDDIPVESIQALLKAAHGELLPAPEPTVSAPVAPN